jgi:hypothetical protein
MPVTPVRVESQTQIDAPQPRVYAWVADYRANRHALLPPAWRDHGFTVEQGGHGAGTTFCHLVRIGLRQRTARFEVQEPVAGRVLVEQGLDIPLTTTWTIYSGPGGFGTKVLLESRWSRSSGLVRALDDALARRQLTRLHEHTFDVLRRDLQPGGPA